MTSSYIGLCLGAALVMTQAAPVEVSSPSRSVRFLVSTTAEGNLTYSVVQGGNVRLEPARAGLIVDDRDLGAGVELGQPQRRSVSEVFLWRGNKSQGTNLCEIAEIPVHAAGGNLDWTLEVRVFDDGVGFRYRVPGSGQRKLRGEPTTWQIPRDATLWFQTDTRNYEGVYRSGRADQVPLQEEGKKGRTHLGPPATIVFADGTFGLISEAALYRYSGLTLEPQGEATFRASFEDDPNGWSHDGPILSPWRILILSKDLHGLVNSDVIPALCDPPDPRIFPEGVRTGWIRPGKAPCTWMVYGNDGAQWDRQKWFVDLCAAIGCEYLLVDAGWRSERWGWMKNGGNVWERAAELCHYAAERNVGIFLWHSYPEGRDDSPGLTKVEAREELFRNCQKAGVKGVKIDFFDSESRSTIDAYEDLLQRSAKYHLMINFHGANKPTGEVRTWPHEISREGIREQEYVLWDVLPLEHYGALPFTRMAAGHADFLPGYIQPRFLKDTTRIFQMAAAVVFSSPFLCWPDNPEAYLNSPLLSFVRNLPVTWDETRILPGSRIGDTVIMARRNGTEWYVAALNCRQERQTLDLDLSTLPPMGKEWTLYRDALSSSAIQIDAGVTPPEGGKLSVQLPPGGGFIAHLGDPKSYAGWK